MVDANFKNLALAIIYMGARDYLVTDEEINKLTDVEFKRRRMHDKKDAEKFFESKWFNFLCEGVGLNSDYIYSMLIEERGKNETNNM